MLQSIFDDTPKIIGFMITLLIIQAVAGTKFTMMILSLLLLGQIITNPSILTKIPFFGGKANE
jgi:hypothetical protein